ncbi:MAG: isopeptide-forming domain-containing fimbrial protein, partial [Clostridiales bacterium]|nr:isopeptide-forming domain-containing fimbrial protein [Clostridiales bacterium]
MSKLKKLASALLALVMAFGLTCTAFAAGTYTITITSEKSGHTYEAYQVFTGDLDATETVLSNVVWGSGVKDADLLDALKADNTVVGKDADDNNITVASLFASCTTAADVAKVLSDNNSNTALAEAFAQIASENLSTTVAGTSTETATAGTYKITGLAAGYYLVKNKDDSVTADGDAYTDIILEVVDDVSIDEKATYPTLDKDVLMDDDSTYGDYNTGSIGDTVTYKLTSAVPDVSAYDKYYFVVDDTLSTGLTFNNDVKITIGTTTLTKDSDYYVSTSTVTGGTEIKIVLKDAVTLLGKYAENTAITITYTATINQDADITTTGNPNTAKLIYSIATIKITGSSLTLGTTP